LVRKEAKQRQREVRIRTGTFVVLDSLITFAQTNLSSFHPLSLFRLSTFLPLLLPTCLLAPSYPSLALLLLLLLLGMVGLMVLVVVGAARREPAFSRFAA